jgi:hypothetical protein
MTATDVPSVIGLDVMAALAAQPRVDSIRLSTRAWQDRDPGRSR